MKGSSNEGQFKKARKMMPEFFGKSGSGAEKAKGNVMDKENPKALRLANGGSARQPRSAGMKFVKRDMGGMIGGDAPMLPGRTPTVDSVSSMLGPQKGIGTPPIGGPKGALGRLGTNVGGGPAGALGRLGGGVGGQEADVAARTRQGGSRGGGDPAGAMGRLGAGVAPGDPRGALGRLGAGMAKPAVMATPEPVPAAAPQIDPQMGGDNGGGGFKRGGAIGPRNKLSRLATGGAAQQPIKRAMGGVGKIRHDEAKPSGKPKQAPKGKKMFEAI